MTKAVKPTPSERDEDLAALAEMAPRIEELQRRLSNMIDRRRLIWDRRLNVAKDTNKATLARASNCHSMNVTQGLKPELIEQAKARVQL
jgi:hypothetical protein